MKNTIARFGLVLLVLILSGCNLPGPQAGADLVATAAVQTFEAMTQAAPLQPPGPTLPGPAQPLDTPTLGAPPAEVPTLTLTATTGPTPTLTLTPNGTVTREPGVGTIAGNILGYPYGAVPSLTVVAFEQEKPFNFWYLILSAGSSYYSMDGYISTGSYKLVVYDPSGNAGGCSTVVEVKKDQTVICDVTQWSGSFPSKPDGVP